MKRMIQKMLVFMVLLSTVTTYVFADASVTVFAEGNNADVAVVETLQTVDSEETLISQEESVEDVQVEEVGQQVSDDEAIVENDDTDENETADDTAATNETSEGDETQEEIFTVTFDTEGGSVVDSQEVTADETVECPETPVKEGYDFDGWYLDEEKTILYDFESPVEGSFTVYAAWVWNGTTELDVTGPEFGAIPNDDLDDAAAINQALARAKTIDSDITVYLPAGTYYINSPLYIYSNTHLKLNANAKIVSRDSGDVSAMLYGNSIDGVNKGGYDQIKHVQISGGTWQGNGNAGLLSCAFVVQHAEDIYIHDLTVTDFTDHVINVSADKDVLVENVTFQNHIKYTGTSDQFWTAAFPYGTEGRYGFVEVIHTDYAGEGEGGIVQDGTVCNNIVVNNCTFNGVLAGIGTHHEDSSHKAVGVKVTNCTFTNLKYGAAVNAYSFDSLVMENNTITGSEKGIIAIGSSGAVSGNKITSSNLGSTFGILHFENSNITAKDNTLSSASKFAVLIKGGKVTVSNNTISDSVDIAIKVEAGTSEAIISGNIINKVGSYGIFAKDVAGDVKIESNTLKGNGKVGIYVENCSSTNNNIKGNTVSFGSQNNIVAQSSAVTISNNILSGSSANGIYIVNGTVTVSGNDISGAASNGIFASGGSVVADNNKISNSGADAIRADANASLTVSNNKLTDAKRYNIYVTNSKKAVTISGNTMSGSKSEVGILIEKCSGDNKIKDNTITTGSFAGIYVTKCNAVITGNGVTKCTGDGLQTMGDSAAKVTVTIKDNTFKTSSTSKYDILLNSYSVNCVLENNTLGTRGFKAAEGTTYTIKGASGIKDGIYYVNGQRSNATGLTNVDGTWYYLRNGAVDTNVTSLVEYNGAYYYVTKGVLVWGVRTLTQYGGTWYYVDNSKLDWNYTGIFNYNGTDYYIQKGVLKWGVNGLTNVGGTWYYLNNSAVNKGYTGLVQLGSSWYYVQSGVLKWGVNTLVQYNGTWYYVKNSTVDFGYTGIFNYGGTDYYIQKGAIKWGVNGLTNVGGTWYYLSNSAVDKKYTSLINYGGTWYYVNSGKLDWNYTGLTNYGGTWYYVQKGVLKWGANTLVCHNGTWYYVNNSAVDWKYTGLFNYGGTWYYIQKGVLKWGVNTLVLHNGTWYYINNSSINWNYTGLVNYNGTWYYVQKGVLKWGVNTLVLYNGTWYYVNNSAINWNYTGLVLYNGTWYYIQKGVLKWGERTLVNHGGTWYYVNNSTVDWNFTGIVNYGGTEYYIQKGVLKWGYNGTVTYNGKKYTVVNSTVKK